MAPITRRKGNRYASLYDAYERADSVHVELEVTPEGHKKDLYAAMRAQIEDITNQLAELFLYDIPQRCVISAECYTFKPLNSHMLIP